jgi:hypothetical protein
VTALSILYGIATGIPAAGAKLMVES